MTSCTEPEYTCSLFVGCTSCSTMKDGTSCMNTFKASCHGGKIASKKFQEMTGAKLMSVSRGNCNLSSSEKRTCEGSPPEQKDTRNISRETSTGASKTCMKIFPAECSCSTSGTDSTSTFWPAWTWKNPQANFDDLENSVPPQESNDELLDQAWDDHTGESLDAKKVKEARQLEMEYDDKMHVFDKVPFAQWWERTGKAH